MPTKVLLFLILLGTCSFASFSSIAQMDRQPHYSPLLSPIRGMDSETTALLVRRSKENPNEVIFTDLQTGTSLVIDETKDLDTELDSKLQQSPMKDRGLKFLIYAALEAGYPPNASGNLGLLMGKVRSHVTPGTTKKEVRTNKYLGLYDAKSTGLSVELQAGFDGYAVSAGVYTLGSLTFLWIPFFADIDTLSLIYHRYWDERDPVPALGVQYTKDLFILPIILRFQTAVLKKLEESGFRFQASVGFGLPLGLFPNLWF